MDAPEYIQKELKRIGGTALSGQPRYRLHWTGDALQRPGLSDVKFESPCDCWALLQWVDTDSESPEHGGGYCVLQAFRDGLNPVMLDTEALNLRVLTMMVNMAEETRHQFLKLRKKVLERRREREEKEITNRLADYLQDRVPQFTGPTSFPNQDAGTVVLQQTIEKLEKAMPTVAAFRKRFRGVQGIA